MHFSAFRGVLVGNLLSVRSGCPHGRVEGVDLPGIHGARARGAGRRGLVPSLARAAADVPATPGGPKDAHGGMRRQTRRPVSE